MDGARLMNAVVKLGVKPTEILQHVDSVSVCLSKGIGAPVGSILAGSASQIDRCLVLKAPEILYLCILIALFVCGRPWEEAGANQAVWLMRPWWLWTAWWSALQRITSTAGHWLKVQ
jgi:hypothetical protein